MNKQYPIPQSSPAAAPASGGTVTSVSGTANQIDVASGTTTPVLSVSSTLTAPGTVTVPQAGALSQAAVSVTGAPITGGSGTTTFPLFYLNSGVAPIDWSTSGTVLGINAPSGFVGNLIDCRTNGGTVALSVGSTGAVLSASNMTCGSSASFIFAGRSRFSSASSGVVNITNSGSTGLTRLQLGLTTSSGPALGISGTTVTLQLGDGTTGGAFTAPILTSTAAGAASTPSVSVTGAPFTGGSGTTTTPLFYLNSGATPVSTWSTSGTVIGINAPSGFAGNFESFYVNNGAVLYSVDNSGKITTASSIQVGASNGLLWNGRSKLLSPVDGKVEITNSGGTDVAIHCQFGGTTSSFPEWKRAASSTVLAARLADDSADSPVSASSLALSSTITSYAGVATVGNGVPAEITAVDLTAQVAAKTTTTLYAVPAAGAGMYRVGVYAKITSAGSVSSVLGGANGFQITYTDPTDSVVVTAGVIDLTNTSLSANTTQTVYMGSAVFAAKASTNIQYAFDYTSAGTAMAYKLSVKLEYLG